MRNQSIFVVGHFFSLVLFSHLDMNIEKVSERNFIYAVNYETILTALNTTESTAVSLIDTIRAEVSVYEPLVIHISTYSRICNLSSSILIDTYLEVKKAFISLKSNEYIITPLDEWYPKGLLEMRLPPPFLYVKGDLSLLKNPIVTVTGALNPSNEAVEVTKEVVSELVHHDMSIASGLQKGIEGAVHLTTLAQKGKAIALLSSPLHLVATPLHHTLQSYIGSHGLVISPFAPNRGNKRWYVSVQKEILAYISHAIILPEDRDGGSGVRCATVALLAQRNACIYRHTLENRSLLWPRKMEKSNLVIVLNRGESICRKLHIEKKKEKRLDNVSQLSLFD